MESRKNKTDAQRFDKDQAEQSPRDRRLVTSFGDDFSNSGGKAVQEPEYQKQPFRIDNACVDTLPSEERAADVDNRQPQNPQSCETTHHHPGKNQQRPSDE